MTIPNKIGKGKGSGPKANFERTGRPPEWCVLECTTISTDEMKYCGLKSYLTTLTAVCTCWGPRFKVFSSWFHYRTTAGER